jgi:serine/threonine-protein kinase
VHPNIVQVFDFGLDEHQHQHFIVMEHVPGQSCAEILRDHGPLDVDQAVDVLSQACRGLDYAHRHGVVHRDVKPGNLLLSDADVVKLADFGIARATDQSSITQVGSVLGTAAYLAPEQARGEEAGARADLYSLGVVAYQLLSGRLPYEANSLSELALKQQRESPLPLEELNPQVPHTLARAVEMALAIDQTHRPADAMLLADALVNGAHGIDPLPEGVPTVHLGGGGGTEATQMLPPSERDPTAATRMITSAPPATGRTAPIRRRPAPLPETGRVPAGRAAAGRAPAGRPARGSAPARAAAPARRRSNRGARRFVALLVVVLLFVGVVAAALSIAAGTSNSVVHFRKVVSHDAQSAINQVQNLVNKYTK